MPFKSDAQRRWGHTAAGKAALGASLAEWDAASKGLKLPARVTPTKRPAIVKAPHTRKSRPVALPSVQVSPLAKMLGLK